MSHVCYLVIPACPESFFRKDSRQAGVTDGKRDFDRALGVKTVYTFDRRHFKNIEGMETKAP